MAIQTGSILNQRYAIAEALGKGGLARTFAATRLEDQLPVVVKELRFAQLDSWKPYDLFQREVRVLNQLQHPAIPRCLEAFELSDGTDTCYYLVLEKVPGQSLQQKIDQGWRPGENEVRELALQILEVLAYLHQLAPPVVHRDLKPSNLMLDKDRLYLIDFGAVQDVLRPEGGSTVVGTFGYMAPEQLTGRTLPASDLYALGATLVSILSGRSPGELPQHELKLDFKDYVSVSPDFQAWLDKILEPVWEKRYQSAAEAQQALLSPAAPAVEVLRQPLGTRVELLRAGQALSIRIPPGRLNPPMLYLTFFSVFWLSFVAFWTLMAARGSVFFALFSLPFWLVGLGMARTVVLNLFGESLLELTPHHFDLQSHLWNYPLKRIQGELPDISAVHLAANLRMNQTTLMALTLEAGASSLSFGGNLSRHEQLWLQSEILAFLSRNLPAAQLRQVQTLSDNPGRGDGYSRYLSS